MKLDDKVGRVLSKLVSETSVWNADVTRSIKKAKKSMLKIMREDPILEPLLDAQAEIARLKKDKKHDETFWQIKFENDGDTINELKEELARLNDMLKSNGDMINRYIDRCKVHEKALQEIANYKASFSMGCIDIARRALEGGTIELEKRNLVAKGMA